MITLYMDDPEPLYQQGKALQVICTRRSNRVKIVFEVAFLFYAPEVSENNFFLNLILMFIININSHGLQFIIHIMDKIALLIVII